MNNTKLIGRHLDAGAQSGSDVAGKDRTTRWLRGVAGVLGAWLVVGVSGGALAQDSWSSVPGKSKVDGGKSDPETGSESGRQNQGGSGEEKGAEQGARTGAWAVIIGVCRGEGAAEEAARLLHQVRTTGNLPEAYAERRGPAVVIAYGRYPSADDAQAQADLKRIREMEVEGTRPYQLVYLGPPVRGEIAGGTPEYSLLRVKEQYGEEAIYTLQVAVYGGEKLNAPTELELRDARRTAEDLVKQLRQEGELAFYHHGPRVSTVTVGVFTIKDFDPQTPGYKSPALTAAQRRHPYNLYNGRGVREKIRGMKEGRLQPSNLVAIPTGTAADRGDQPPRR